MSDKVIVSKQDLNDLPFVEQEHSGDKYVLLEDIKHWLEDATPVSVGAVAEVRCRNNEVFGYIGSRVVQDMLPLGTKLYTTPQPADTVPIKKFNKLLEAVKELLFESEEYDFDDGLGQGALQQYWDNLQIAYDDVVGEQHYANDAEAIKGE